MSNCCFPHFTQILVFLEQEENSIRDEYSKNKYARGALTLIELPTYKNVVHNSFMFNSNFLIKYLNNDMKFSM